MNLKSEVTKSSPFVLESIGNNMKKINKNIDTFTRHKKGKKLSYEAIQLGLCISCVNRGNCQWQENNKIYCEHYL